MTQELTDLKKSILARHYSEALAIIDELEEIERKAILRNIKSFLIRMLIHLIKNQIEMRMTNSWAASIQDSILEIQDLNLQDNQTSYYVKSEDWNALLEESLSRAISTASVEVCNGVYSPFQLKTIVNTAGILQTAQELLNLMYQYSTSCLLDVINEYLSQLPGGEVWKFGQA